MHSIILIYFIVHLTIQSSFGAITTYNVVKFGATPYGLKNSTKAFADTWAAACAVRGSTVILVPQGKYLLYPISFNGNKCNMSDISLRLYGTLVAPQNYTILGTSNSWLEFYRVTNLSITGGTLDAKGSSLWACKAANTTKCPAGATTLRFTRSKYVVVRGVVCLNSQLYHMVIKNSENVRVEAVRIVASAQSPNTDGIHVQSSRDVVISNSNIRTGDDCISIGPGTANLVIERVACGPGHGISIGSLGKEAEEAGVEKVTVRYSVFNGSTNGVRIKSWGRPTTGYVRGVLVEGVVMRNVRNPIIVDQNYCPHHWKCPKGESGVRISDVVYRNIQGTSATRLGVTLNCSAAYPCTRINLQNVTLTYNNHTAPWLCNNAFLDSLKSIYPQNCSSLLPTGN